MSFKEIKPEELQKNPFQMIGKEWLLVTAEKDGKANTMTASWGGVGVMWGRNVAFIVIRPQRYTKEFIDASDKLSLSVLDEEYRKTLSYLGSVSGRDEDKIAKSGLTVAHTDDVPYFAEANTVIDPGLYTEDQTFNLSRQFTSCKTFYNRSKPWFISFSFDFFYHNTARIIGTAKFCSFFCKERNNCEQHSCN